MREWAFPLGGFVDPNLMELAGWMDREGKLQAGLHCTTSASPLSAIGDSDLVAGAPGTPQHVCVCVCVREKESCVSTETRLLSPSGEHQ